MWMETTDQPIVLFCFGFLGFFKVVKYQMWNAQLKRGKIKLTKLITIIENEVNSKVYPCSFLQEPLASEKPLDMRE